MKIDITPETLKEWDTLSGNIQESIEKFFKEPKDFNHVIPIGYKRDPENPRMGVPVPQHLEVLLGILDRTRFKENCTIKDSIEIARSRGLDVRTSQSLTNALDRTEEAIGLLKPLPPSVDVKARDNRQRLEWRRKRRINRREQVKRNQLKRDRQLIEKELKKQTRKLVDNAKSSKMSSAELMGSSVKDTVKRLKDDAKASKWEAQAEIDKERILFEPTPKQAEFLAASEKVVFYGGAAGGGKSFALIFDAIRYAHRAAMRALVLRRRNSELKELISVSKQFYPKAFPGAKFNESKMIWTFPSGATLEFGYFEKPDDKERYIGLPYSYIGWDEVQLQKSPEGFDFLFSRLRTTDPEITTYVRCTGNPGGAPWVKQRFIDPAPYNTSFIRKNGPDDDSGISYKFIPASMYDNKYLAEDGEYEKILKSMSPTKVKQLLYGDWETMEDAFFQFDKDINISEELPPMHWPIISAHDYGWVDPASAIWAKIDPATGTIHVYRELEMVNATVEQWASRMKEMESQEIYNRVTDRVIDHTLFKMTGHTGPSHLETLNRFGFRCRPADRQREPGWEQVNQRLLPDLAGKAQLIIHKDCVKLIDQLMTAMSKETNPNDINEARLFSHGRKHHWDLLDCLRYLCMARPKAIMQDQLLLSAKQSSTWNKYNNYFN